jgi:molybdopterin adenylyltransferase
VGAAGRRVSARRAAHAGPLGRPAVLAVVTVSDTRGPEDDPSGDLIVGLLAGAGHEVRRRAWARDDLAPIRAAVRAALRDSAIDAVVLTGGTGIAPRDRTPEALAPLLERVLPGFGERFRAASFAEVGGAAWLSRALAGVARGRLVAALPGAPAAVRLAVRDVLLPELGHALRLLGRPSTRAS